MCPRWSPSKQPFTKTALKLMNASLKNKDENSFLFSVRVRAHAVKSKDGRRIEHVASMMIGVLKSTKEPRNSGCFACCQEKGSGLSVTEVQPVQVLFQEMKTWPC